MAGLRGSCAFPSRHVSLALLFRSVGLGFSFSWLEVGLSFIGWELALPSWSGVGPAFSGCGGWPSLRLCLARPYCGWGWPFPPRVGTGPSFFLVKGRFAIPSSSSGGLALLGLGPRGEGWSSLLGMGCPSPLGVGVCPFLLGVRVGLVLSGCGGWPS